MKRRCFLAWSTGGLLLGSRLAGAWVPDFSAIRLQATGMSEAQWALMSQVQEHLLPAERHAPGARDVNATAWLQWVLSDPAVDEARRAFFRQGMEQLQALLRQGGKPFSDLPVMEREALLREFEGLPGGHAWLREVLNHLMEALLTDPVYGGNTGQAGWKWLGHQPGYKRPPAEKRYFLL